MTIFLLRKARFFIMDQLLDILTEVNSPTIDTISKESKIPSSISVSHVSKSTSAEAMWDMIQRLQDL